MRAAAPDASVTRTGATVRLEPLAPAHLDDLCACALDPSLWTMTRKRLETRADVERFIAEALDGRDRGAEIPYAIVDQATGRAIGSTRYKTIRPSERRIEIGWTFIGADWHGRGANSEAKALMIECAFAQGFDTIEFRANLPNVRSHRALAKLGAQRAEDDAQDAVFTLTREGWSAAMKAPI